MEDGSTDLRPPTTDRATNGSVDSVDAARTSLLALALACRSVGKATQPDRMDEVVRSYEALGISLDAFSEVLPRQVGRMLSDMLEESLQTADRRPPTADRLRALRAEVFDPRSFRHAADAVEKVAEEVPNEFLLAYEALPEDRWPKAGIRDVGLFLLGLVLRGVTSIRQRDGEFWVADAHVSVPAVDRATATLLAWHRTYATAAFAQAQAQAQAQGPDTVPVPVPTALPKEVLLSEDQAERLDDLLMLAEHGGLEPMERLRFRRMVGASLFVFLRLLQRPYAALFQAALSFEPVEGASSFLSPRTVQVGSDGDLWGVVRALAQALDRSFGTGPVPRSEEPGPVRAFGEAVRAGTPTEGFVLFTVAYLQVLVGQQGVLPKGEPVLDRSVVRRLHPQFLELLLDEQKRFLVSEGKRIGETRTERTVGAGVGAAALPLLAWLLPKVAK